MTTDTQMIPCTDHELGAISGGCEERTYLDALGDAIGNFIDGMAAAYNDVRANNQN